MKKSKAGFTLIELVVAMAAAAIVIAAAGSVLLLGLRVENRSRDTARDRQTVNTVLSVTEEVAAEGELRRIERNGESWQLILDSGEILLEYRAEDGELLMGGSVLMDELLAASVSVDGKLLTVEIETLQESYSTAIYCRVGDIVG